MRRASRDLFLLWSDHHYHLPPFEPRKTFYHCILDDIALDALDHRLAELRVRHLAALEADGHLDLVALFEKTAQIAHFYIVVAVLGRRPELQFLDFLLLGLALRRMRFFLLLELELAEIHHPANRRVGIRHDFNQIQSRVLGHLQGRVARQDSNLLSISADHAHFRYTYFRILPVSLFGGDNAISSKTCRSIRAASGVAAW